MSPYPSGQFRCIDDPDRQFGNGSVWTRTPTQGDGPEPLLTLAARSVGKPVSAISTLDKMKTQPLGTVKDCEKMAILESIMYQLWDQV